MKKKYSKKRGPVRAKKVSFDGIQFASGLELYMYKALKEANIVNEYEPASYTLLNGFIIECKGRANESFPLRWKLFKHWIALHAPTLALFKPQNQKECDYTIRQIESMRLNLRKNATKKPASL